MRAKVPFLVLLFTLLLSNIDVEAQSTTWRVPQAFNYQIVVRDSNDWIVRYRTIGLRISILNGTTTPATTLYSERHTVVTDRNGYISLNVGTGTPLYGKFDTISWGIYSNVQLKAEGDLNGGTNYTLTTQQQLTAVPFAFLADESQDLGEVVQLGNHAGMKQLKDVKDPTEDQDVITKRYLDSVMADYARRMNHVNYTTRLSFCSGGSGVTYKGKTYTAAGTYRDTVSGLANLAVDTIFTLIVQELQGTHNVDTQTACDSYVWHGTTYNTTSTQTYSYTDANGCASVDTLKLTISPSATLAVTAGSLDQSLCQGSAIETITISYSNANIQVVDLPDGVTYNPGSNSITGTPTTAGTHSYYIGATSTTGCNDTRLSGTLTVLSSLNSLSDSTVCDNDLPILWNGETFTAAGTKNATLTASNGCDSTIAMTLTVNAVANGTDAQTACDSMQWNGTWYTASNNTATKTITKGAANGCDSIATLNLTITPSATLELTAGSLDQSLCQGSAIETITISYSNANIQVVDLPDGVTYNPGSNSITGTPTTAGTHSYYIGATSTTGCNDTRLSGTLTVKATYNTTSDSTVCDNALPILWNGETFTAAGTQNATITASNGCDSTIAMTLTVNAVANGTDAQAACDSLQWNGTWYTASNNTATKTITKGAANGCDSIATLNFTLTGTATHAVESQSACVSYTWHDVARTSTGDYTYGYTNGSGCASVDTLHLTIYPASASTDTRSECDSLRWIDNVKYTADNTTATKTLTDQNGCDSVVTLNLTINHNSSTKYTVTNEGAYTWATSGDKGHGDGLSHTTSGTYVGPLYSSTEGCNSYDTLELTVNGSSIRTTIDTFVCEGIKYIDTLLYEGFENGTFSSGWATTTGSGNSGWTITGTTTIEGTTYNPAVGSYFLHEDGVNTGNWSYLYTPRVSVVDPEHTYISYHWMNSYWQSTSYPNIIRLGYAANQGDTPTTLWNSSYAYDHNVWHTNLLDYSSHGLTAGNYYFTFADGDGGGDLGAFDEVCIYRKQPGRVIPSVVSLATAGSTVVTHDTLTAANGSDSIVDITWHIVAAPAAVNLDTMVLYDNLPLTWNGVTFGSANTSQNTIINAYGCDSVVNMTVNVIKVNNAYYCEGASSSYQYYDTLYYEDFETNTDMTGWDKTRSNTSTMYTWQVNTSISRSNINLAAYSGNSMLVSSLTTKGHISRAFTPTINIDDPANTTLSFMYRIWYNSSYGADELRVCYLDAGSTDQNSAVKLVHYDPSGTGGVYVSSGDISLSAVPSGARRLMFNDYGYYTGSGVDNICVRTLRTVSLPASVTSASAGDVVSDTVTTHLSNGADSMYVMSYYIGKSYNVNDAKTICDNELDYTWNGETFTAAGSKSVTLTDAAGCDSVVNMTLTVNPSPVITLDAGSDTQNICKNNAIETINLNIYNSLPAIATSGALPAGVTYNTSTHSISGTPTQLGSYLFTLTATSDQTPTCGSVQKNIVINVDTTRYTNTSYTICQSDSMVLVKAMDTLFFEDFESANSLDAWTQYENHSVYYRDYWYRAQTTTHRSTTFNAKEGYSMFCAGYTYSKGSSAGVAAVTPLVTIYDPANTTISFDVLRPEMYYNFNYVSGYTPNKMRVGYDFYTSGSSFIASTIAYYDTDESQTDWTHKQYTLSAADDDMQPFSTHGFSFADYDMWSISGIDNVLIYGPRYRVVPAEVRRVIGDTITYDTLQTQYGCDSIIVNTWHVKATALEEVSQTVCSETLPIVWNDSTFTTGGIKSTKLTAANGCDSVVSMTVLTHPVTTVSVTSGNETQAVTTGSAIEDITITYTNSTISVTGLPTGVTYDSENAKITGTPTVAGTYSYTITATSTTGCANASTTGTITVNEP